MQERMRKGGVLALGILIIVLGAVINFPSQTIQTIMFIAGIGIVIYALVTTDKGGGERGRRRQGGRRGGRDEYDDFNDFAPAGPMRGRGPRR